MIIYLDINDYLLLDTYDIRNRCFCDVVNLLNRERNNYVNTWDLCWDDIKFNSSINMNITLQDMFIEVSWQRFHLSVL